MKKIGLISVLILLSLLISCEAKSTAQTTAPAATPVVAAAPAAVPATPAPAPVVTPAPVAVATPAPVAVSSQGTTLQTIKNRGYLVAGVNSANAGFSYLMPDGSYEGFEVEFAKAMSVAVFGTPDKVEYRPLTSKERFTALQSGEIDLLVRTATVTSTRDIELALDFTTPYFYDGQTFLVRKDSGIETLKDLEGATIAVLTGSTSETNLSDIMAANSIKYKPLLFESLDELKNAFFAGRADAWTGDKSSIAATASTYQNAAEYKTLEITISKEPLAIAVRHGDNNWKDIVQWVLFAMFLGDEKNVSSANVDAIKAETKDPELQTMLGVRGETGRTLGLANDWAYQVIKQVGNYAEVFNKHLGPDTVFNVSRGLNTPWTQGGLFYALPFR
ncbi:MAG: amino acid ABC transporter substrate-binding protein [Spirochaetae bacterium HGW-Spirochaetae-8]|jgi:general L-amino acid transport system substrate-binding protein|nr:MAG: amino acid ABC transporter substrate-binding protein [Spirochaetae bacterium HGW-Spirochaetae-8]